MIEIEQSTKLIVLIIAIFGIVLSVFNMAGAIVVLIALAILAYFVGIAPIGLTSFLIFTFLALTTVFVDNVATLIGAKKYGASKTAIIGVIIGSVVGLFAFPPLSVVLGPLIGGILGEIYAKRAVIFGFGRKNSENKDIKGIESSKSRDYATSDSTMGEDRESKLKYTTSSKETDSDNLHGPTDTPQKAFLASLKVGWGLFLGFIAGFIYRFAMTLFLLGWLVKILWF